MKELMKILKAISEPNRLKIINLLSSGDKCVCEIEAELNLSQNLVSHHLKVLKDARLIKSVSKAQWHHYELDVKNVKKFEKDLKEIWKKEKSPQ